MKRILLLISASLLFANCTPTGKIEEVAAKLKSEDTRTVITKVINTDGNPCLPEGESSKVDLQVKTAKYNPINSNVEYDWVTVKSINVSKEGQVMEVCGE